MCFKNNIQFCFEFPHFLHLICFWLSSHIIDSFLTLCRFVNGSEFLLQAHDDAELQQWVAALKAQCQTASGSESRSQTLPASSHQQKDETKKKSFFTLKKK